MVDDDLDASKMNMNPGGKQRIMRDTVWQDRVGMWLLLIRKCSMKHFSLLKSSISARAFLMSSVTIWEVSTPPSCKTTCIPFAKPYE